MAYKVAFCLATRPDIIRCSRLIELLEKNIQIELIFIYTNQHYDRELKDIFFEELGVSEPNYVLDTADKSTIQQHAKLISQLEAVLVKEKPDACMFLGDTNAVIGCITPLKLNIPIIHAEGGMRSYDFGMPEEKNRVIIDRISDVLYVYQEDYKYRLIQEGVCPDKIVVTGNTIVDVLKKHSGRISGTASKVLKEHNLIPRNYALMTMHRNEHMNIAEASSIIFQIEKWAQGRGIKVVLPVMPRLLKILKHRDFNVPMDSFILLKPLGFFEFVALESCALIEFTDSGTNQEVSAILGTHCVVIRKSTERPETFDSGITIMEKKRIGDAADFILTQKKNTSFSLGNGNTATIIIEDLLKRLKHGFSGVNLPLDAFKSRNFTTYSNRLI